MNENSYQGLLAQLKQLSRQKQSWYSVAVTVEKMKSGADGPQQVAQRMKDASEATGLSTNELNRMAGVREYFDSAKEAIGMGGIDANTLSFLSLEVTRRLHQVSPEEGFKMVAAVATGQTTYRELRAHYNKVVSENTKAASAQQIAKLEARDFEEAARLAILAAPDKLFSDMPRFKISYPRSARMPIDAIGFDERKGTPLIGFEFIVLRVPGNPKQILETMLYRTLYYSSLFSRFWIVIASNIGNDRINTLSSILRQLKRPSIGVAVLPWGTDKSRTDGNLKVILHPTGDPNPDYREKFDELEHLRNSLIRS